MKVLIANRGEIGLRVARACRDAGIRSVAVYADQDRDAPHVRAADAAYALGGSTAAATYLDQMKLLDVAGRAEATAVHPGYGFLAENAGFARAVLAAGLTWIGPPPEAMDALADKVSARRVARRVGAPLLPGTLDPVPDAGAVADFARAHGLPLAIKAVLGGGGRGMRVVREWGEIPELFAAASREAAAAFGDGACYVERYLDRPRHVETQCLADSFGQVVVVSTRDCTLQRRHQKLVEEAPAPFLTDDQKASVVTASIAILADVGYVGAGTCEFLLGDDGSIAFLEVNTRLQVEHCVTEEVSGIDLVREQLRIAGGEALGYDSVPLRGHAIEFRINAEDPARDFLPVPGMITAWRPPSGPGVRLDSGVEAGSEVSGAFDSLLAKLVVTGTDRASALARARRALAEFEVEGIPTVIPFHRAVLDEDAFAPSDPAQPFAVHTGWIEAEFLTSAPCPSAFSARSGGGDPERGQSQRVVVEVDGRRFEVAFPDGVPDAGGTARPAPPGRRPRPAGRGRAPASGSSATSGNGVTAPMQGTVVRVEVEEGQDVAAGDTILVLEAMKMEQPLTAPRAGRVTHLNAVAGATLSSGALVCELT